MESNDTIINAPDSQLASNQETRVGSESDENGTIIEFDHVDIGYSNRLVLENINLDIQKGEYIGIIGPNGSGKTSFLKSLLNLIAPLNGQIWLAGKEIDKSFRNRIGYVPQSNTIPRDFPLSVREAVMMGRYGQIGMFRWPKEEDREAVHHALLQVHMHEFVNRPIGHLSGGEQQKILIARALARQPTILLLDEPTSALDFEMTQSVFKLVDELHDKYGLTIIMVHHNINLIRKHCHRLLIFDRMIRFDGDPQDPIADKAIRIAYNLEEGDFE